MAVQASRWIVMLQNVCGLHDVHRVVLLLDGSIPD